MDYFVGPDVSLRSVAVCVIDTSGGAVLERSVPCEIEDIAQCLAGFDASGLRIGFEAGAMSQFLYFGLRSAGFVVVCMEARQVNAALSAMRNKTDKTKARGIAQVLLSGWFNPVHIKSREAHAVRALLSSRKAVQRKCIDLANEIRGLFRIFGHRLPSSVDQASFDERVRPIIEADPDLSHALLPLLDARAMLFETYPSPNEMKNIVAPIIFTNILSSKAAPIIFPITRKKAATKTMEMAIINKRMLREILITRRLGSLGVDHYVLALRQSHR